MAQTNISNTRDRNGNLVRSSAADKQRAIHGQLNGKQSSSSTAKLGPDRRPKLIPDLSRCFPYASVAKMSTRRGEPAGLPERHGAGPRCRPFKPVFPIRLGPVSRQGLS
jgi:hypothetical protein